MTYQTELPEGFKTWNELWYIYKKEQEGNDYFYHQDEAYSVDEVCRMCYDEIKIIMQDYPFPEHKNIKDLSKMLESCMTRICVLTHTKLFK